MVIEETHHGQTVMGETRQVMGAPPDIYEFIVTAIKLDRVLYARRHMKFRAMLRHHEETSNIISWPDRSHMTNRQRWQQYQFETGALP